MDGLGVVILVITLLMVFCKEDFLNLNNIEIDLGNVEVCSLERMMQDKWAVVVLLYVVHLQNVILVVAQDRLILSDLEQDNNQNV
jgi:hypothetical protein